MGTRSARSLLSGCASAAVITALVACTALDGLAGGATPPPDVTTPVDDAGRPNACAKDLDGDHDNCGACGTVCGGMEHCLAGKCAPGCPDHNVYVSADGNDNASGCTTATPKRTVGAGVALLKTLSAQKHTLRVCRGQYDESVVLDYAADVFGGYECSTWKRSAGYGAPTFDGTNESVIRGTATAAPLSVVKVQGITIDGITFRAQDAAGKRSAAATVSDMAKVTFANVKLLGGAGTTTESPGSVGLLLDTGAFAEVRSAVVDGGSASATNGGYASTGIFLLAKAGGFRVVESRVSGGAGRVSAGTGSAGIFALGASLASSVERSVIDGGKGHTGVGSASFGIGFYIGGAASDITVSSSTIDGGSGGCAGTCGSNGVAVATKGKVVLHGNRITGGEAKADTIEDISYNAIRVGSFASVDIQNNFVFTGNSNARYSAGGEALELGTGGDALIVGNTFAIGPTRKEAGALVVSSGVKSTTLANNLFLNAAPTATAVTVDLDACEGRKFALHHNGWVGFPAGNALFRFKRSNSVCAALPEPPVHTTIQALEADARGFVGTAEVSGNRRLAATCEAGDSACSAIAACSTPAGCLGSVLSAWDPKTAGGLLATGWKLKDGGTCLLAKGGKTLPGLLATDGFATPRSELRSIGAHEHEGACQ